MGRVYIEYYKKKVGIVAFLQSLNKKKVLTIEKYPRYMSYRYEIHRNLKELHKSLIKTSMLNASSDKELLQKLKVSELKEILKENNLSTSGKKEELVERIEQSLKPHKFRKKFSKDKVYFLSESGRAYIERNRFFLDIHRKSEMDNFEGLLEKFLTSNFSNFNDILWAQLQQEKIVHQSRRDYALLRNTHLSMARILQEEGNLKQALIEYLKVIYIDLSGYGNNNTLESFSLLFIAPGISKKIKELSGYLDESVFESVYKEKLPFRYFSKKQYESIVNEIATGLEVDLKRYK